MVAPFFFQSGTVASAVLIFCAQFFHTIESTRCNDERHKHNGTVVDPENGKEYKGKIWAVNKDTLRMRGFIGISLLGRTETWTRIK